MPLPTIDTHEFTRRGDTVDGAAPLAGFERLGSLLAATDGALAWRLSGRSELGPDGSRRPLLRLVVEGTVRMPCVRCLEPLEVPLRVLRDYRLVASEAQAEREDADEEDVDLLVSSRRFDLAALLEDEAIMALPPAPRHDDCRAPQGSAAPSSPDTPAAGSDAASGRRTPFSVLGALLGSGDPPGAPGGAGGRGGPAVAPGVPGVPGPSGEASAAQGTAGESGEGGLGGGTPGRDAPRRDPRSRRR